MTSIKVDMDIDDALKQIAKISKEVEAEAKDEIEATALDVIRDAKRVVRVDTSRLKDSIAVVGRSANSLSVQVGTEVEYASFVEAKYPYLFPAMEKNRPKLLKRLTNMIKNADR